MREHGRVRAQAEPERPIAPARRDDVARAAACWLGASLRRMGRRRPRGEGEMTVGQFATDGVDIDATLRVLSMLPGDPTIALAPGRLVRATHTPDGPGTITATWERGETSVDVTTAGPAAGWLMERAPALLGLADDGGGFEPTGGPLRDVWRRHRGLRVPRTDTLWHDLCWLVVQQRIQGVDAARQWRLLVQRHGSPAEGNDGLHHPPSPEQLAGIASHEFHQLGIERRRADTLRSIALGTSNLARLVERPVDEAAAILVGRPGIGPWTTGMLSAITWGHPDAVIAGDSGIPSLVTWVLAGQRAGDDRAMVDLLEPFRPHRYRVLQLAFASGLRPPRRAPRSARRDISRH